MCIRKIWVIIRKIYTERVQNNMKKVSEVRSNSHVKYKTWCFCFIGEYTIRKVKKNQKDIIECLHRKYSHIGLISIYEDTFLGTICVVNFLDLVSHA